MRHWLGENREWDRPSEQASSPNLRRDWGQEHDRDPYDFSPRRSFGRRSYDRPSVRDGSVADRSNLEREEYLRYRGHGGGDRG